jgi:hypothetical protein
MCTISISRLVLKPVPAGEMAHDDVLFESTQLVNLAEGCLGEDARCIPKDAAEISYPSQAKPW